MLTNPQPKFIQRTNNNSREKEREKEKVETAKKEELLLIVV